MVTMPSWMPFQRKQEITPRPMRGEVSFRDPMLYPLHTGWAPYNPDIFVMKKGGLDVYDKMRRDEQVKACQWIKRLSVLCSGWNVEPISDENADIEVADFCKDVLGRLPGTFEEKLKQIMSGMDYGFSVTEKVWGYLDAGNFRGKIALTQLKTRKPHRWDFDTDEYGNLKPQGLWQLNGQYKYEPDKFIVYTHGKEFDNWYGVSDLQAAYRAWWSKDVIIKFWNIFLERFGQGIPMLHPKEGKRIDDPTYTALKNAIFNLQQSSALAWNIDGPEVSLLEASRRGSGEYDKAIEYYDRAISRALLMPTGLGFSEDSMKGGSYARSKTHFDIWLWIMLDLRKTIEETIMNEQVIPELVDYNFTVQGYPKFKFNPLDEPEVDKLADMWLKAVQGKAVHPDVEDELHFRRLIKFPEREREELEADIEEAKATPPPPMPPNRQTIPVEEIQHDIGPEDVHVNKPLKVVRSHAQWFRELTKYEKRVDFAGVEKTLNNIESETRMRLVAILERQRDKLLASVERNADKIDQKWVNRLSLQYGREIQAELKEFMRTTFEMGRMNAGTEISRSKGRKHQLYIIKIPPKETIGMLEDSAFWIKNVMLDTLTKQIQALLLNMLETGEAPIETLMKIRQAYDPYIGDTQIVRDQRQIEPYRIETVIRTNATKAYNQGKLVEFADPELDGYVRAVQLSAILDTRTTDICRAADGKIVMLDDPTVKRMTPPLHHNCRTIAVPVTEADGQFEPSKQSEIETVLSDMPADFGGNIDR